MCIQVDYILPEILRTRNIQISDQTVNMKDLPVPKYVHPDYELRNCRSNCQINLHTQKTCYKIDFGVILLKISQFLFFFIYSYKVQ